MPLSLGATTNYELSSSYLPYVIMLSVGKIMQRLYWVNEYGAMVE